MLYAEDAELLQERDAFLNYLRKRDPEQIRVALIELFNVLDTPVDERDPYLSDELKAFPYINGGLYSKDVKITIPQFTENIKVDLLLNASQEFDWSEISPTIFGAVFESTLNPETRRAGGMHYTSVENIHKVIDPLFLNDLKEELKKLEGTKGDSLKERRTRFRAFQDKLSKINIFDPACGSGNFLTESYLSLRKLENRAIENIQGDQSSFDIENANSIIKVSISQFYGIEINDFAVSVAKTALWIAEEQMMEATQEIVYAPFDFLPLKSNSNIHEGNALRMDWNDVLPAEKCSYICGNPPFISQGGSSDKGQRKNAGKSKEQAEELAEIFKGIKGSGNLDYVACWFKKSAEYMKKNNLIEAGLVSTNSICQGQQVEPLWGYLLDKGVVINFAHTSFLWTNEAHSQALVYVVIIGFALKARKQKCLYRYKNYKEPLPVLITDNINGYLAPAPNVIASKHSKPLCNVAEMSKGFQPTDNGYLLLSSKEYEEVLASDSRASAWVRPFSMGEDFIKGKDRYCLWLNKDGSWKDIEYIRARVDACAKWRSEQSETGDAYKLKDIPYKLRPCNKFHDQIYIGIPVCTSSNREYVPFGFVKNGMIPGNQLYFVETCSLYHFGVMLSQFQNAWMRQVAGYMGPSYRYSNTIVYNNFVWPGAVEYPDVPVEEAVDVEVRTKVESCAQAVLDARDNYPDKSLADLYDPDKMPSDLLEAHKALDVAVEAAYGVDFQGDEEKIVAHLFKLYAEMTKGE